ncbi:MAG: hypothetical protein KGY76_07910, partial [Candidatus Thermoplasmatota archaeon]|nr:hypothetical protein [Candidatus Thermoplasmatota archaeon]
MMLKKTMIVFVMFLLILSSLSISMASTDNSLEETGPTKTGERTEDDGIDEETKFSSRSRWSEEDEPPYLVSELDGLEVTLSASLPETEFVNAKMPDGESYSVITSARQGKGE